MPIEIRELIIRTQIVSEGLREKHDQKPHLPREKSLVEQCVQKVLRELRKKNQR